ncbi:hypothetical protein [Delftia acidovorans]|uniref:hypothetical protein n=1 Tax=Delftia acidovorans TaxID=80866 RepID=UPI001E3EAE00|nr:hypothetical protein [Delftia acidovorans]
MDTSLIGLDLTAVAGVLALAWMARATARRTRSGPQDSVWSAPRDRPAHQDTKDSPAPAS